MVDKYTWKKYFRVLDLVRIPSLISFFILLLLPPRSYGQQPSNGDLLNCSRVFKIVVLGSSTAYGTGAVPIDSSYVNKYNNYIHSKDPQNTIINLATPSLTTYNVLCPTGFVPPSNRPFPVDTNRNITKALTYHPDAIIINLPTNDVALGIPQQESKDNYERTMALADSANIPVWVTTTQPRNTLSPTERGYLMEFRDWTYQRFGGKAIDFWTDVANVDGTINSFYSFGDGVHVNNEGHSLFYSRTMNKHILDSLCAAPRTYVFVGTGNWDIMTNWVNNLMPPTALPPGSQIQINPAGTTECVLNVQQTILPGCTITILPGKKLRVIGSLIIQ